MQIHFSLLSIASLVLLLFFGSLGTTELHSWEVGINVSPDEVRVTVDPVFAVWVPQAVVYAIGCNALACGNVMVLDEQTRDTVCGDYLLEHESTHIEQYRALGLLTWPAQFFIDIEPPKGIIQDWNDPTQPDRTMWLPPSWWWSQWHFITLHSP